MYDNNFVAAIDIGTTKIVAIAGRKSKLGQLEILGIGKAESKGVRRGVVMNIEETSSAIIEAVSMAEQMAGIKFKEVFVGIAGQHIKSLKAHNHRYITSIDSEIKQVDVDALNAEMYKIPLEAGEEIIHVIPQSYIVDSETGIKNPVGMFGKRLEANFHIVIGQVASARNIVRCIERAGLKLLNLILEPLASSESVLTEDEKEAGVALVDIGGGTTDLAVYYDGIIRHTAVIPFGGNAITKDIKEGCAILQRQAESLKVQYGSALADFEKEDKVVTIPGITGRDPKEISFKSLACIIQARMEEVMEAILYEIENSGYASKLSAGIAITGGGALLKHLPQLVKFKTGYDVRIGYPTRYFQSGISEEFNQPIYATSIGLILKGYLHYDSQKREAPKKEEPVIQQKIVETPFAEEERPEIQEPKKESFIKTFKKTFMDIFDEKETKM